MKTTIDLFEHWELIPQKVKRVLDKYGDKYGDIDTYELLRRLKKALNKIGYNINYGLDAEPFGLHQMKFCK